MMETKKPMRWAVMDNPNRKPISTVEFQAIWRKVPSLFEVMMEAIAMGKRTEQQPDNVYDHANLYIDALIKIIKIKHGMPRDEHGAGEYYQARLALAQEIAENVLEHLPSPSRKEP